MTPSRDELRAHLEGQTPPEPRPAFVERLGYRLQALDQATERRHVPVFRRPPAFGFLALAIIAVVVGLVFTSLPERGGDRRLDVSGQPPAGVPDEPGTVTPEATTTTAAAGTGTTTPTVTRPGGPPPTVNPGATGTERLPAVPELPAAPTTTQQPTATTRPRTEPTTTTTSAPSPSETLTLSCVGGQPEGQPGVQCDWSQSTAPAFYAYRLWRATSSGPKQQVTAVPVRTITRYIDRPGTGVWRYEVEVVDNSGRVVGASPIVEATCC